MSATMEDSQPVDWKRQLGSCSTCQTIHQDTDGWTEYCDIDYADVEVTRHACRSCTVLCQIVEHYFPKWQEEYSRISLHIAFTYEPSDLVMLDVLGFRLDRPRNRPNKRKFEIYVPCSKSQDLDFHGYWSSYQQCPLMIRGK